MKPLVVLAGGKSTRMGKDKIFLPICDGETFLEALLRRAYGLFDPVILSAGSAAHAQQMAELLYEKRSTFPHLPRIIPDRYPEKGPMGGLVTVLEETGLSRFAVIAADIPKADLEVVSFLYDRCGETFCLLRDEAGREEPLVGAYGEKTLRRMQQLLAEGNYRIRDAFQDEGRTYSAEEMQIEFPEKDAADLTERFQNINTEEDYRKHIK